MDTEEYFWKSYLATGKFRAIRREQEGIDLMLEYVRELGRAFLTVLRIANVGV